MASPQHDEWSPEEAAWYDFLSDPAKIYAAASKAAGEIKSLPSDTAKDATEAVKLATYAWVFPALQILQRQAVVFALVVTLLRNVVDWGLLRWVAFIACAMMQETFWLTHEWEMPLGTKRLNTLHVLLLLNAVRYGAELVVVPTSRTIGRALAFWWFYPAKRLTVSAMALVGLAGLWARLWWLGVGAPWWMLTGFATVALVVLAGAWFFAKDTPAKDDPDTPESTALLKKNAELLKERVEELEGEVKMLEDESNLSALRDHRERLMLENARLLSDKVDQLQTENARLQYQIKASAEETADAKDDPILRAIRQGSGNVALFQDPPSFDVNDEVEAKPTDSGRRYFPAKIERVNRNGTYDVRWDPPDEDEDPVTKGVPPRWIRRRGSGEQARGSVSIHKVGSYTPQ